MPEFPDVTVYVEALTERVLNQPIQKIRIGSPFVLRSFEPPLSAAEGKKVLALRRVGSASFSSSKTIFFLIVHLMIAGRFHGNRRARRSPVNMDRRPSIFPTAHCS
jgi:formamidopyrimidine-DNA glycosylase